VVEVQAGSLPVEEELVEFGVVARSQSRIVLRRFLRHRVAMIALVVLVLMTLAAFLAPHYYKYSYTQLTPDLSKAPSTTHWFGTDELGKDTYAKVMRGATKSLEVGLLVALFSTAVGVLVGAIAGFYRGFVDAALMRFTDLFLVIPDLAVLLVVANHFRGRSGNWLAIALVITAFAWMYQARLTRSEFLALREREFVRSARALGASDVRIIWRHLLPNALGSIIVNATLTVAVAVLTESTLSFLGFGISPPDTSLGRLVSDGVSAAQTRWWLFYAPGLWLVLLLLCVSFLGDGLRDAFDPKQDRVRA
jgi:peptide/nickel transport system permease protein